MSASSFIIYETTDFQSARRCVYNFASAIMMMIVCAVFASGDGWMDEYCTANGTILGIIYVVWLCVVHNRLCDMFVYSFFFFLLNIFTCKMRRAMIMIKLENILQLKHVYDYVDDVNMMNC